MRPLSLIGTLSIFSIMGAMSLALAAPARAEAPAVVATIKPLHSLVAGVMEGVGTPRLLIDGAGSPHAFSLKPSDARRLQDARIIFWIGPTLETFLERALKSLPRKAAVVDMMGARGIVRLKARPAGIHDDNAAPAPAPEATHGHGHGHGHDHAHDHGEVDAHIWLDTRNAIAMTRAIASALAQADSANRARYFTNARAQEARLTALDRALAARFAPLRQKPFVVFHDAYHYLEKRYDLQAAAAITVAPERPPGAQRIATVRDLIKRTGASCVFIEPQFAPRVAEVVTEGTGARIAVLDPLGASLDAGPAAYDKLMNGLADGLTGCLSR